jgi:hypothetical protein
MVKGLGELRYRVGVWAMVGRCLKVLVGHLKDIVGDLFSCKAKEFSV